MTNLVRIPFLVWALFPFGGCSDPSPTASPSPSVELEASDVPESGEKSTPDPSAPDSSESERIEGGAEASGSEGDACSAAQDCEAGLFCIQSSEGAVCGSSCDSICGEGKNCTPSEGGLLVCEPHAEEPSLEPLCRPCVNDADCSETLSGARCNSYGPIGSFCGRPCDIAAPCPEGYTCDGTKQCIRVEGACTCSEDAILTEAKTLCFSLPGGEPCEGIRWCTEEGLTPCSSSDLEQCDGIDNNCNGLVDEDLSECAPETPVDEDGDGFSLLEGDCDDSNGDRYPGASDVCDGVDNDCDGEVDEAGEGMPCLLSNDFGECEGSSTCENGIPGCIGEPANECGGCGALPSNYQSPCSCEGTIDCSGECVGGITQECSPTPCFVGVDGLSGSVGCPDTCSECLLVPWRTCACSAGFGEASLTFSPAAIAFGESVTIVGWFPEEPGPLGLRLNGLSCLEAPDFECANPADCEGFTAGWSDLPLSLFQLGTNKAEILQWSSNTPCAEQDTVLLLGFLPFPP